jgi:hypothetical protein
MSQLSLANKAPPDKVLVWELTMSSLPELGGAGGFVRVADFKGKKEVTVIIAEAPRIVPSQFKDSKGKTINRCRVTLKLPNGEPKAWTMNNTTYSRLLAKFGKKPKAWIGKKVKLSVMKMLVRNEPRDVIYGEPV